MVGMNRRSFLAGGGVGVAVLAAGAAVGPDPRRQRQMHELNACALPSGAGRPLGRQQLVWSVPTLAPLAALTFDDGPDPEFTPRILAVLASYGARATFNLMGCNALRHPDLVAEAVRAGHELGNHTWSHPALAGYKPEPMLAEIERCRDKLAEVTGTPGTFFRQSQGQHATQQELVEAGKAGYARVLSYDVDSLDWKDPGPAAIRAAVAGARAGSVVSMHLGHAGTVAALPGIFTDLKERGLTAVTATELLK
jgi:peptidoglycan/xylan/chitin deacetylase (PgdA/CDA1 family)